MARIWAFAVPNEVPQGNYPDNGVKYPSRMIASDGGLAYTKDQVQGMPLLGKAAGRSSWEYQIGGRAFGDRSHTRLFQLEYLLNDTCGSRWASDFLETNRFSGPVLVLVRPGSLSNGQKI